MKIKKSSRHQKIIGDFGENAICDFLSKSGFEVTIVDHTGIDLIAYNPKTKQRLGISVKSRTRSRKEANLQPVMIFPSKDLMGGKRKVLEACKAFACEPWVGLYVETEEYADLYLTSLKNFEKRYCNRKNSSAAWGMSNVIRDRYKKDPNVKHVRITFDYRSWF